MSIIERFKRGLYIASKSFNLLWDNKKLILYLGIPISVKSIFDIIIYNLYEAPEIAKLVLFRQKPISTLLKVSEYYKIIGTFVFSLFHLIFFLLLTLGNVAITYHIHKICKNKKVGFRQIILACKTKFRIAICWAALTFLPIPFYFAIKNNFLKTTLENMVILHWLIIFLFIIWFTTTTFVVQAITLEDFGILRSIKRSFATIRYMLLEYLGAIFWIGLIIVISLLPFIIVENTAICDGQLTLTAAYIIITALSAIIPTTYTISKTLLFEKYVAKTPKSPY